MLDISLEGITLLMCTTAVLGVYSDVHTVTHCVQWCIHSDTL